MRYKYMYDRQHIRVHLNYTLKIIVYSYNSLFLHATYVSEFTPIIRSNLRFHSKIHTYIDQNNVSLNSPCIPSAYNARTNCTRSTCINISEEKFTGFGIITAQCIKGVNYSNTSNDELIQSIYQKSYLKIYTIEIKMRFS